jgi:hypothetical protein
MATQNRTQRFTIIAQDPSVRVPKKDEEGRESLAILTVQVDVPAEVLAPGPRGYRVQVIDYNSSTGELYTPLDYKTLGGGRYCDPFIDESDTTLLSNPTFHAQNVYAIIMRTLARFEYALGRRVSWSFNGHQLLVGPHAFAEANAFYSKRDRSLLFGYFPKLREAAAAREKSNGRNGGGPGDAPAAETSWVFTCLSHDIVVHETTHAIVDGLRRRYTDPSSPEQAGFHEGLADVIALLSIFSLPGVVERVIDLGRPSGGDATRIALNNLTVEALRESIVLGLAEEFGSEASDEKSGVRKSALRRSVDLAPPAELDPPRAPDYYMASEEFLEPHRRGELLVAAMMNAFLKVWSGRLKALGNAPVAGQRRKRAGAVFLDRQRVVEEGAAAADYLLTMAIRALDYTPPTDLEFCDYLSAILTADYEIRPDDSKYRFREELLESFRAYGMNPTSKGTAEPGVWEPPDATLNYERTRFESLTRDPDEVFRFIWENRAELGLEEDAYTQVLSVRPCLRTNPDDGFALHETVAEYYQQINIEADELKQFGIKAPPEMLARFRGREVTVYGGGVLIFDEFGRVKFHIRNRILNPDRQTRRLKYLWKYGYFNDPGAGGDSERRFAEMHRQRFNIFPVRSLHRRNGDGDIREGEQWGERFTRGDKEIDLDRTVEDLAGGQAGEEREAP